jgi:hypothetical protein
MKTADDFPACKIGQIFQDRSGLGCQKTVKKSLLHGLVRLIAERILGKKLNLEAPNFRRRQMLAERLLSADATSAKCDTLRREATYG